jgi:hypothetical protein
VSTSSLRDVTPAGGLSVLSTRSVLPTAWCIRSQIAFA